TGIPNTTVFAVVIALVEVAALLAAFAAVRRVLVQERSARQQAESSAADLAALKAIAKKHEDALSAKAMHAEQLSELVGRFEREMGEPLDILHSAGQDLHKNVD